MSKNCRDNISMYQKCFNALIKHTPAVQFIFENGNDTVKIQANKVALAASSPVFNGELRETGHVKITDASPEAFQEFLQFFYDFQVNLTMENIAEVLKLVDKYDVADCLPVCSDFLKKNVKIDDVLWALHLAIQFNLDDLKIFCEQMVKQHYKTVIDMINLENGQLRLASGNRLLDSDLDKIIPYVFALSKNVISSMSKEWDSLLLPVTLVSNFLSNHGVTNNESIQFTMNKQMLLAKIICSKITICDSSMRLMDHSFHKFDVTIDENSSSGENKILHKRMVIIWFDCVDKSYIKLQPPLQIQPDCIYTITFRTNDIPVGLTTQHAITVPHAAIELKPGTQIRFLRVGHHSNSLISQLFFKCDQE